MTTKIPIDISALPLGSIVQLFEIGENYVQIGYIETGKRDAEGTLSRGIAFSACTCPEGFTSIALSLCGVKPCCCEHAKEAVRLSVEGITDVV
jgi:hypothetical protein